ncbi:hypothetical protein MTO96_011855 [Rhipicephalus appendiculatus]
MDLKRLMLRNVVCALESSLNGELMVTGKAFTDPLCGQQIGYERRARKEPRRLAAATRQPDPSPPPAPRVSPTRLLRPF